MRYRRVLEHSRIAMVLGGACMAGFAAGRLTKGDREYWILFGFWALNVIYWMRELSREQRRENDEFQAEMEKIAEEIARKQLMEEE